MLETEIENGNGTDTDNGTDNGENTGGLPSYEEVVADLTLATEAWLNEKARMRQIVYDMIAFRNQIADNIGIADNTLTNHHHAFANVRYGQRITLDHVRVQLEEWALEYQTLDEYSPCIVFDLDDESIYVDGDNIVNDNPEDELGYLMNVVNDPIEVKIGSIIKMPRIESTWISKEEHVFVGWSTNKATSWAEHYLSSGYTLSAEVPVRVDTTPETSEYGGAASAPEFEPPLGSGANETQMEMVTFRQEPDVFRIPWTTPPSTAEKKTIITFYPIFAPSVINYNPYKDDSVDPNPSPTKKS